MSEFEKYQQICREAGWTGAALLVLIVFWVFAGFGLASVEGEIFGLPLWAVTSSIGVWFFAIVLDGAVIGEIGLRHIDEGKKECELSIHLQNDAVKNKGYGMQAERLAIRYAFDRLGMERILADSVVKNTRSQHVLKKLGFAFLGEEEGFKKYRLERKEQE